MGKKNKQSKENKDNSKEKSKDHKEVSDNTSGGIRKFFARISRKRNKERKNTEKILPVGKDEEKHNNIGKDENNSENKDVSGDGQTRRRSSSTGRCKPGFTFRETFGNHFRTAPSDDDLNTTINRASLRKSDDSLQKDPEIITSHKLAQKPGNAASGQSACSRSGSVSCRPSLLIDCPPPLKSLPQFTSLPSSPTHYEGGSQVSSRRSYASDPPSPSSCNAGYPDHRTDELSTSLMTKTALRERRRQRQRYHAEKHTSCEDATSDGPPLQRNEIAIQNDPYGSEVQNSEHPLSFESLSESQRKAAISRMSLSKSGMESGRRVFSYDSNLDHLANGHGNVYRINHVDSVSLQSASPTSTLERQRSARENNEQEDRGLQNVEDKDASPMIHYHLTIQNCDGINIYVNNPSTDTVCASGVQVDDGGLLKRLSWSQSNGAPSSSVSSPGYRQQASCTDLPVSAPGKSGDRPDRSRSPEKHLQKYTTVVSRDCSSHLSDHRNTTDSKSKVVDNKLPWYISKSSQSSEMSSSRQRTVPVATQTSSQSVTQTRRKSDSSSVCDQENSQITTRNCSEVDNNDSRCQPMRPVAHVSPRRRVQPNVHTEQRTQRPTAPQQQRQHQQQQQQHHQQQEQQQQQQHFHSQQQLRQPSIQSRRTVLIQNNSSARDWMQRSQSEARELTSSFNYVSGSFSSLTTEALLEADANGDVSASDLDSTLNDESYSSSESTVSVVEVTTTGYNNRQSIIDDYRQDTRPSELQRHEATSPRPTSAERHQSYLPPTDAYQRQQNASLRRIQSMRDYRHPGGWIFRDRYADISQELARVPGVLIVSHRRDRLLVYLSRDRPNVEGVVRFMVSHNIPQSLYDCQIMPYGTDTRHTVTSAEMMLHSR